MSSRRVATQELVGPEHQVEWGTLLTCQDVAKAVMNPKGWIVFAWEDTPGAIKKVCNLNGGDEDWVAITTAEPNWLPSWVSRLDSCDEPDTYLLQGVVIYVGSH
jgi:hypothetical protein